MTTREQDLLLSFVEKVSKKHGYICLIFEQYEEPNVILIQPRKTQWQNKRSVYKYSKILSSAKLPNEISEITVRVIDEAPLATDPQNRRVFKIRISTK